jgi:hypothetical protein
VAGYGRACGDHQRAQLRHERTGGSTDFACASALSVRDATATGADQQTTRGSSARQSDSGEHAAGRGELVAEGGRLEVASTREAIPGWLCRKVAALDGKTPLATLAAVTVASRSPGSPRI